jgi:glycosyltransferase involved in cell wall biosynthesis
MYLNTSSLLQSKGHEVIYLSQAHSQNLPSSTDNFFPAYTDYNSSSLVEKVASSWTFAYSKKASTNLDELIHFKRPDIAHLHIFYGGLTSSILPVLKKHNIPIIVTLHEYKLLCPVYTFLDGRNQICEKCANGNYLHCIANRCSKGSIANSIVMAAEAKARDVFFKPEKYFNHIICVSQFSLQKHIQYRPALANRISHVYNFSASLENVPLGSKGKKKYILYFGRLSAEKGISTLLRSFQSVSQELELYIVGTGPLQQDLANYSKEQNLNHVKFLGFQMGEALHTLIREALFVIVPSEWYENNPMTIIESYFLGTPVIGANIGGIPEIIIDGITGFTFSSRDEGDLAKKINCGLALETVQYEAMCKKARNFAEVHFSSEHHYKKLMSIYSTALNTASLQ